MNIKITVEFDEILLENNYIKIFLCLKFKNILFNKFNQ